MLYDVKKNIFVFTKGFSDDYDWFRVPHYLNKDYLLKLMDSEFERINKNEIFTSGWYRLGLPSTNCSCVFRIVVDGKKDINNELIKRYEGTIVYNSDMIFSSIDEALVEYRNETNDYNYLGDNVEDEKMLRN